MEPGLLYAYLALGAMAVVPIVIGSYASLKRLPRPKRSKPAAHDASSSEDEPDTEHLRKEDAYWFPIIGSCVLFSLYLVFRFLDKEWVNYLLAGYFGIIGVAALGDVVERGITAVTGWKEHGYHLRLTKRAREHFDLRFTHMTLIGYAVSIACVGVYIYTKHWTLSNLLGFAFAATAVQLISLDSFGTGMILLSGLFFYDLFWVFGTEVMVSVARNFDAPIKVVFPRDLFAEKPQFAMLGLGDIVIPGVFVALCLRFDQWRQMRTPATLKAMTSRTDFTATYFRSCFAAYVLGLVATVYVMHTWQAAQPALLYLSPACILSVLITGAVRGELSLVFAFRSDEEEQAKKKEEAAATKKAAAPAEDKKLASGDEAEDDGVTSDGAEKKKKKKKRGGK